MKLVIDIDEEIYDEIVFYGTIIDEDRDYVAERIANGTSLPKGHGDLIDGTVLYNDLIELEDLAFNRVNDTPSVILDRPNPAYIKYNAQLNVWTALKHKVFDAPTIIPADKSEVEG